MYKFLLILETIGGVGSGIYISPTDRNRYHLLHHYQPITWQYSTHYITNNQSHCSILCHYHCSLLFLLLHRRLLLFCCLLNVHALCCCCCCCCCCCVVLSTIYYMQYPHLGELEESGVVQHHALAPLPLHEFHCIPSAVKGK